MSNTGKSIEGIKDLHGNILGQLPAPVMAVDKDFKLVFVNDAACRLLGKREDELLGKFCHDTFCTDHCGTGQCRMKRVMEGEEPVSVRNSIEINGRRIPIEYTSDALRNDKGEIIGGLEFIIDISEVAAKEEKLKEQGRTIMEISTPVIQLWDKILVLPVVGVVDSYRAQQMMDTMLNKLKSTGSKIIILDIQGVAAVDSAVANHFIKIAKATRLMGCTCILSGISPAVAQTLVQLGIDLGTVRTNSNLQESLSDSFRILHYRVMDEGDRYGE